MFALINRIKEAKKAIEMLDNAQRVLCDDINLSMEGYKEAGLKAAEAYKAAVAAYEKDLGRLREKVISCATLRETKSADLIPGRITRTYETYEDGEREYLFSIDGEKVCCAEIREKYDAFLDC